MNSLMVQMIEMAHTMRSNMEANNEMKKDRIREQWEESKKFPRKKKKQVRKELLLDWSIANWNPFDDYNFNI